LGTSRPRRTPPNKPNFWNKTSNPVCQDYINADTVAALLRQLATIFADLPITIVLDNARYQHCRKVIELAAELGIELLFLPPYSPNLNLIE
jgi:transposase